MPHFHVNIGTDFRSVFSKHNPGKSEPRSDWIFSPWRTSTSCTQASRRKFEYFAFSVTTGEISKRSFLPQNWKIFAFTSFPNVFVLLPKPTDASAYSPTARSSCWRTLHSCKSTLNHMLMVEISKFVANFSNNLFYKLQPLIDVGNIFEISVIHISCPDSQTAFFSRQINLAFKLSDHSEICNKFRNFHHNDTGLICFVLEDVVLRPVRSITRLNFYCGVDISEIVRFSGYKIFQDCLRSCLE